MISAELLEQDFHSFFDSIGFSRIEKLVGQSPSFSNADYIDEKNKVLVELKIIEKDFFKNGGIIDSLCAFVPVPVGKVQPNKNGLLAPGLYQIEMPPLNREGKRDSFEEPLRRSIKKANRQLKETNRILLNSKGYNVVMVALHMPTLTDIFSAYRLAEKLISEFSSIHAFLVCTPILALKGDQVSCIHGIRSDVPEQIEKLIADIGDQFCHFFLHPGAQV